MTAQGKTEGRHPGSSLRYGIFAKPIHLNLPLRKMLAENEKSLDVLTREQLQILKFIEYIPRVTIDTVLRFK